ncbi:MAG: hypothetical protein IKS51_04780 [Erysipelotrichaceae bacterium]|nr:hypothetical protein [Erysipelotrichaceae bacterium]
MKKIVIILLVLSMLAGCGSSAAIDTSPGKDYDISKLSFEEFDELYGQMIYEGLPEDRKNLAMGEANGTWRYNIKIRNDSSGGGMSEELGFAEMIVSNNADPRIQIVLHPRLVDDGDRTREKTDEEAGYEPFGGDFDENKKLKLTGNDCVLEIKRFYSWNGKEYLIAAMWFSEEESGDFMMIREQASDETNISNDIDPEDEIIPYSEVIGNSKPIYDTPCEGITVSAEANAFYKDTEVKFTTVDDSMESFLTAEDDLFEQGYMTVAAWEVDAGLNGDEIIPGQYDVTIDLATLDIDPSMYDCIRMLRVNDEGEYYVYSSSLDGSKLTFSSNQNSVVAMTIYLGILGAVMVGAAVTEYYARNKYYIWERKFDPLKGDVEVVHRTTRYGSFCVEWVMKDADPQMAEISTRMAEIEQHYKDEAEEYRKVLNVFERMRSNYHVAEYYRQSLEADQEYKELLKRLKMPELVEYTIKCVETAYEYLGGKERLYMPKYEVPFKIVNNVGALGEAMNRYVSSAYINLRLHEMQTGGQIDRDNYLLTITHELLHICQNRYRLQIDPRTDTPRFDEMVALYLERDARAYYQDQGIITTDPKLTDSNYWGTLRVPLNYEPAELGKDQLNNLMIHEGYNLGRFAMYLADTHPEKKVTARNFLIARTYLGIPGSAVTKADIPDILCSVFALSPKKLGQYYRDWLISERKAVEENVYVAYYAREYKPTNWIVAEPGGKPHFNAIVDGDYFMKIHTFIQQTTGTVQPSILVPDADLADKYPEVTLLPAADYYPTSKGYFIPGFINYDGGAKAHNFLGIMEIHGLRGDSKATGESGATLYVLNKTPKPIVTDDKESRKVIISFPEPSEAAKDHVIEGYCVSVLTTSGVNVKKFFEFKEGTFDRTIYLGYDDIADKDDPSNPVEITITLCEYATNTDNEKKLLGIESDPVNITVVPSAKQQGTVLKPYYGPIETGEPYNNPLMAALGRFVEADDEHDYDYYLNRVYNYISEKPVLDLKANGDFTITYGGTSFAFDKFAGAYNGGNISVDGFTISGHVTMGKSFKDMGINSDKINTPYEWVADNLKMEPSSVSVTAGWLVQYWEYTRPQWCPSELYETYGIHETEIPKEGGGTQKAWYYFSKKGWYENMQYAQNGILHVSWNEAENRYDFVLSEYLDMSTRYYSDEELVTNTGECKDWSVDNFQTYGYFNGEKPD